MDRYRQFPDDTEFKSKIQSKDVYNFRSTKYLLESLENFKRKELANAENHTIEHIMPQNPKTSLEWQQELGEHWKEVKRKYLHTLGNLSLTGYNSELSDRPFADKKTIEGGFNDGPLFLDKLVKAVKVWNEQAINKRGAKLLAERALKVWPWPYLDADVLKMHKTPENTRDMEQDKDPKQDEASQDDELLELYCF